MSVPRIFISYRREDSAGYARALFTKLDESFPKQVFMDVFSIELGDDFVVDLEKALRSCKAAIVVIGKKWLTAKDAWGRRRLDQRNDYVRLEVATVLKRGIKVIPALVGGATLPPENPPRGKGLPPGKRLPPGMRLLSHRDYLQFSDQDWSNDVDKLIVPLKHAMGLRVSKAAANRASAKTSKEKIANLQQKFQPLPQLFHLSLKDVAAKATMAAVDRSGQLVFHTVGNTGGVGNPSFQLLVAQHMQKQAARSPRKNQPAFFYHLGDVVYYRGEAKNYYSQFYAPYAHYPAPIFAIPGNHDGDVDPLHPVPSLQAFVRNFCAATPSSPSEAGDSGRPAMTQPNPYWTLDTPLATIIGLYTNVPEGGMLDENQSKWLVAELLAAPPDRALILAMHHPIYAWSNRPNPYLGSVVDKAVEISGRYPDLVLTSHVMNYQRFTRTAGRRQIPYLIVGAGGYRNLRDLPRQESGAPITTPVLLPGEPNVRLASYCSDRHGFMRVTVTRERLSCDYFSVSKRDGPGAEARRSDAFCLDLHLHRLVPVAR
jgi:hypothetical protein